MQLQEKKWDETDSWAESGKIESQKQASCYGRSKIESQNKYCVTTTAVLFLPSSKNPFSFLLDGKAIT